MCKISTVVAIVAGSVICPSMLVVWSATDAPDVGVRDTEPRPVVAHPLEPGTSDQNDEPATRAGRAIEPLTADEQELVAWAYERFALVGLDLPRVDITFHDDTAPCGGHHGRYRGAGERRHVAVCVPDRATFASRLQRQRTLVHELAHAWDHATLNPRDRIDLLDILDASDWDAPDSDWDERGVERFAETIVWGLYDQLRRPVLIDVPCRELHADFHAITGTHAPGPLEDACKTKPHPSRPHPTEGT